MIKKEKQKEVIKNIFLMCNAVVLMIQIIISNLEKQISNTKSIITKDQKVEDLKGKLSKNYKKYKKEKFEN